ncbi:MAG: hypothetical protein AW06_002927 [Candidatus Accumulibacter cognatus]|uniref:Uncharacterized protein n=1 Tax=Candidatus Accumulibacter cognatus TaxID=2954383 RepID=A0A080M3W0_9PROT|nr:MAG: hypothetical protein AW06_002927 [Candidatus Accumulibacter cognatus]
MRLEQTGEFAAGELATLISVEDLRAAVAVDGFPHRVQTEVGRQGVGKPPGKDPPREPVDHGEQVEKASAHRDVGDVRRPRLIGPLDREAAQEVGMDFIPPLPTRGVGLPIEGFDPHARHQGADVLAPGLEALGAE